MNASEFNVTGNVPEDLSEIPRSVEIISNTTLQMIEKVAYHGIIPTMAVAGLICNVFSFVLLCPIKERSTTNIYLIALTVCDVCILFNALAFSAIRIFDAIREAEGTRIRYMLIPVFISYISPLSSSISNYLVTLIALERFMAVVFPFKVRIVCDRRFAVFAVLGCYVIPAIVSCPLALLYEYKQITNNETGAIVDTVLLTAFGRDRVTVNIIYICTEVVLRFTPVALVTVASTVTIFSLLYQSWNTQLRIHRLPTRQREVQVSITLLILTTSFLLANLPGTINRVILFLQSDIYSAWQNNNLQYTFRTCSYTIFVANSCINFPIYVITCRVYREKFKKLMCRKIQIKSAKYMFKRQAAPVSVISR